MKLSSFLNRFNGLWSFRVQGPLLKSLYDSGGLRHLSWRCLLVQQHLHSRPEEAGEASQESQLCLVEFS